MHLCNQNYENTVTTTSCLPQTLNNDEFAIQHPDLIVMVVSASKKKDSLGNPILRLTYIIPYGSMPTVEGTAVHPETSRHHTPVTLPTVDGQIIQTPIHEL